MYISGRNNIYGNPVNEKLFGVKKTEKMEKKEEISLTEKAEKENPDQKEDSLEISPEGRLAAALEQEMQELADSDIEAQEDQIVSEEKDDEKVSGEQDDQSVSEGRSGKVAVNEGKRRRQIAAAKSQGQVQQVLALLQKDLSDCKAGLEKGWCDQSEIAKVEALINSAKARMSQVPQNADQENGQGGLDEFAMASLM